MPASTHKQAPNNSTDPTEGGGIASPRQRATVAAPDTDQLFQALDGRHVDVLGAPQQIDVYAVFDGGGHRWVQVLLAGRSRIMVTLKLALGDGVAEALSALRSDTAVSCALFAPFVAHNLALR
jgi:hypothetical protein